MNPAGKNKNRHSRVAASVSLMSFALSLFLSAPAPADAAGELVAESAAMDVVKAPDAATPPENTVTLYGSVKKRQAAIDATADDNAGKLQGAADDNVGKLQGEQAANAEESLFRLAVKKLAAGEELSSDEFRSLKVGLCGFESSRTFFQPVGRVTIVYRNSPADNAGIRRGDRILSNDTDEEAKANPEQPRYQVTFDQAGTSAEMTILRHGRPVVYTLTRMNMEDIQEPEIRQRWEDIVRSLGFPKGGAFTGTSMHDLKFAPNIGTDKL